MKSRFVAVALIASVAAVVALAGSSIAQIKIGKSRPLTTKQLMAGSIKPSHTALGNLLQGNGPADEAGWANAATQAALLNESTYTMMDDGRCPDQAWYDACMTMRKSSVTILEKVAAKDAAGAREAFTAFTGGCKACHTAHKK